MVGYSCNSNISKSAGLYLEVARISANIKVKEA